jgi:hypothetical protein
VFCCLWQKLTGCRHLAKDELENITEDKWTDEVWGVELMDSESKAQAPKLIFYFAEEVSEVFHREPDKAYVK